jgi:hypothetical protein
MRIWSLHPKYLDRQGLLACWRESLLAQKVLKGQTRGYRHHPQLERFRSRSNPLECIGSYLSGLVEEAEVRGYQFDRFKIEAPGTEVRIPVTRGQVQFEWEHLRRKLEQRDLTRFEQTHLVNSPEVHPLFSIVEGSVERWEKV